LRGGQGEALNLLGLCSGLRMGAPRLQTRRGGRRRVPVVDWEAPVFDWNAPVFDWSAPVSGWSAPVVDWNAPVSDWNAPVFD
jgi:hypothetical protein